MACQQLISHVSASGRYLQNLAAEYHPRAVIGQIAAVKIYIEKLAGPNEAMQASEAIQTQIGPYLTASQKGDLQGLLNDAACKLPLVIAGKTPASASGGQQYWQDTFWRDVPKDVFEAIGDKSAPATARMQKVFKYLADIGLRAPSEKTFSAMLALFFYADGCPAGITSATLLAAVQQIKDAWKAYIQEYRKCTPNADNASWSWPGVPAGVICVRLDFIRFMNIFGQIPCRTSHGSMQHLRRSVSGQPLTVFESNFRNRALTLEDTGEFSPRAGAGGPLALDFQGHRGIAAGALVGAGEDVVVRPNGGEGRLALLGPAAELALPGPAAELALPAPAVGGEAAPARVSLAAVTAQLLADSARRDAEQKAKAKEKREKLAAKKAKDKKKKMKAADKDAAEKKTKKAPGKKRKMKAADKEDAAEKKTAGKKKKTSGKKLKKISKKRLMLGKKNKSLAQASKTPLAHASDLPICKECGSPDYLELADGNLAELCVWCAEAQADAQAAEAQADAQAAEAQADAQPAICKKPAACVKQICKKPAICKKAAARPSGTVPPEADRKANRNADPTAQKIFFMRWGCSKCRWQAGCTTSCWRDRDMEKPEDVN